MALKGEIRKSPGTSHGAHAKVHNTFGQWYCVIHDSGEYVGRHRLSGKWGRRTVNLEVKADSFKINLNGGAFG